MRPIVLALLITLLFVSQINFIISKDIWLHLKTGEYIFKNLEIPRYDLFSYTLGNHRWINHEWLTQIIFYIVFHLSGVLGLIALKAIVISAVFCLIFRLAYRKDNLIVSVFFIIMALFAFNYRSSLSPEIFTFLFMAVFLYVIQKEKNIWVLSLVQILWVNMHGYFIIGPFIVLLYMLGELVSRNFSKFRTLAVLFIVIVLTCLINPNFIEGAFYPLRIISGAFTDQPFFRKYIQELQPPVYQFFKIYIFYWIFAILSTLTFPVNIKKTELSLALLFACSFLVSYLTIRNIPIFIFMAAPISVINLTNWRYLKTIDRYIFDRKYYYNYSIIVFIIFMLIAVFLSNGYYKWSNQFNVRKTGFGFSPVYLPEDACSFIEKNNLQGNIFNTCDFGAYIAYRLYPAKIFIDGRTEFYGVEYFRDYVRMQNYPKEWESAVKKYNFNILFLRHPLSSNERILKYLYNSNEWKLVYHDKISVIFVKNTKENAGIIEKFQIDFNKRKLQQSDLTLSDAIFLEKIGRIELAEKIYGAILNSRPDIQTAGIRLVSIYINTARDKEALRVIRDLLLYHSESAELCAKMSAAYLNLGENEKAFAWIKKSAKLDPYFKETAYILGILYFKEGEMERAFFQFDKYLKLDPYNPEVHRLLGDIYRQKGLLKQAEAEYNEAGALEGIN